MGFADLEPFLRKKKIQTPLIGLITRSPYVTATLEPIDGKRHRRGSDTHVLGERRELDRIGRTQVIQNADLMRAQQRSAFRISDVTGMTSKIDARVMVQDGP